ncbi:hypothetical protein AMECASPLE_039624 [Ameca splendens]|uniref:Uncharacterized protein n=1 Tax=Ameca splendens TaxID=208324 RepID=A0ABV0YJL2_9TELE
MTPSHSSHIFKSRFNSPLCPLLSLSSVSRQTPAGGQKSSPGKGLCVSLMKTAVRTSFLGVYRPAGILRRSWNPAPKDQINVRFKQPTILITSQKEERDKELVIFLQRGERTKMFSLTISRRSEPICPHLSFYYHSGVPSYKERCSLKDGKQQLHRKQVINSFIF